MEKRERPTLIEGLRRQAAYASDRARMPILDTLASIVEADEHGEKRIACDRHVEAWGVG